LYGLQTKVVQTLKLSTIVFTAANAAACRPAGASVSVPNQRFSHILKHKQSNINLQSLGNNNTFAICVFILIDKENDLTEVTHAYLHSY
jgi:hypothetical protein